MLNPSVENALILRRIPKNGTIAIRDLIEYVDADFKKGIDGGAIDPTKVFREGVNYHINALIQEDALVGGFDYHLFRGPYSHVSLSGSTAFCLETQPGIKALTIELPISNAGFLDLFAQEC